MADMPPSHLDWIKTRLDRLEQRVTTIEADCRKTRAELIKGINNAIDGGRLDHIHIRELASTVGALQQKVFPNLQRDLDAVEKLIGVDFSDPLSPLDRREAEKKHTN